jgi:type IV secretion system protein VirB1
MDFLSFAQACGPLVDPVTTTAIVRTESGFDPLVLRDNTVHVTLHPRTRREAENILANRLAAGHRLAIGLMQITNVWATRLKIEPQSFLDACANITMGTAILAADYQDCEKTGATPETALVCALSMYWSGSGRIGGAYVNRVFALAGSTMRVPETLGVTDGVLGLGAKSVAVPSFRVFHYRTQTFTYSDVSTVGFDFRKGEF